MPVRPPRGSPQDEQSTELSNELIGKMVLAGGRPDRAAGRHLPARRQPAALEQPAVNRAVGGYVRMLRNLYSLASPDLCADIGSWGASGYKRCPRRRRPFVAAFIPDWVSLGVLPAGLARFETPGLQCDRAGAPQRYESRADRNGSPPGRNLGGDHERAAC